MALYGLLIPFLFLFVGVGIDLGWYYLNVSRLQNAADAAALAGAQTLVKEEDFNNYIVMSLASNELPEDFDDYKNAFTNAIGKSGTLRNYKEIEEVKDSLDAGREAAEEYTRKNLLDATDVPESSDDPNILSATDGWSISKEDADKKVSGTIELKYKIVDGKNDVYGPMYYVVNLTEKIRHLFMPGWFEDMDAPVRAVVLLKPRYLGLIEPMQQLERTMIIDNWEYTNQYKDPKTGLSVSGGKWNHYMAGNTDDKTGIDYKSGNVYRTETVEVKTTVTKNKDGKIRDGGQATAANGNKFYKENEVDSLNIDFQAEIDYNFQTDWDLGQALSGQKYVHVEGGNSWGIGNGDDKRIHFNVAFNDAWQTRKTGNYDPLWVRIESEPIKNPYPGKTPKYNSVRQITLNFNETNVDENDPYKYRPYVFFYTGPEHRDYALDENDVLVRHSQPVVLNLNEDLNAIIYMPESPVIINGNGNKLHGFVIAKCYLHSVTEEDMRGNDSIKLYDGFNEMEDLPGNFEAGRDGYGQTVFFHDNENDTDDGVLTKEQIAAFHGKNATITTDPTTGNLVVTELIQAPEYPIISFTKDLYTGCKTLADYFTITANYINSTYTKEKYMQATELSENEVSMIRFPDEPEVLRNASGIIPNPNTAGLTYGNFTTITIPVATADLLNEDPDPETLTKDNKYVKVLRKIVVDGKEAFEEKYIAKSKLPHMRVKWNANYPYVCIYDLKTGLGWGMESPFLCVKPMDNSTSTADSAIVFTNSKDSKIAGSNQWGDVWVIEYQLLDKNYDVNYIANKLEFVENKNDSGINFFMLKSDIKTDPEVVGKYKKIVMLDEDGEVIKDDEGNEVVKYIREDADIEYYTKVDKNVDDEGTVINYIIVDKTGTILTKPVTAPELRIPENNESVAQNEELKTTAESGNSDLSVYWNTYTRDPKDPEEIPGDRGKIENGKYIGRSDYRKYENYRIPAFERVYKSEKAFNLSTDSRYSYFDIEELWRVNYTYLNVDGIHHIVNREPVENDTWDVKDMFFTKKRAEWID